LDFTPSATDAALLFLFMFLFVSFGWLSANLIVGLTARSEATPAGSAVSCLEWLVCGLLGAFAATSIVLLSSAQLGVFRIRYWLVLLAVFDVAALFVGFSLGRRRVLPQRPLCRFERRDLWLLPLLAFAFWMMNRPAEFVATYRDPGEYVNIAVKLADSPSLRIQDPQFQDFAAPEKQSLFLREPLDRAPFPEVLPGFYLADGQQGELLPQFFHLYPLWLALCFKLWRFEGIFLFNVALGTLGVFCAAALTEQLLGSRVVAWAAGLLLANNVGQIWMSRSPFSEMLAQFFLLGALTLLAIGMRRQNKGAIALARIAFGLCLFVRIDSVVILLALSVALVFLPYRRWLAWPLVGATLWGLVHVWFFSFPYFVNVYRSLEAGTPLWTYAGLGQLLSVALAVWFVWVLFRKVKAKLFLPRLLMLLLGVTFLYGVFVRPRLQSSRETAHLPPPHSGTISLRNEINWVRLGWYLTPTGLGISLVGMLLAIRRLFDPDERKFLLPFTAILVALGGVYLYKSRAFPDNYWVIRRYVEIVIPGALLLACLALQRISQLRLRFLPEKTGAVIAAAVYWVILAGEARAAWSFWGQRELVGTMKQMEELAGRNKDADVLLLEQGTFQEFFSGPLKFVFRKAVYPLATDSLLAPDFEAVVEGWQREGKRIHLLASHEETVVESRRLRFIPKGLFVLKTRVVEPPYDRLPQSMTDLQFHLQIYEVQRREVLPAAREVTLNMDFSFGHATRGFHSVETTADLEAFRWTSGQASVNLPALRVDDDARLTLRLAQKVPAGTACLPVRVLFNRQPVIEQTLSEKFEVIHCRIPKGNLNRSHTGENGITLESASYIPANAAPNDDQRQLGIMVEGIRLESLSPISKAGPFMLDVGDEADLLQAGLSGFYERDRDSYRWSGPVAEVRLPARLDLAGGLRLSLRALKSCQDPAFRQWLTAELDGQVLGKTELVGTGTDFKVYEFPLPSKLASTSQPIVRLSVVPAWNPNQRGVSIDTRTLGCAVDWIRIE